MSIAASQPRVLAEVIRTPWVRDIALIAVATVSIAAAAQVAIPLPFSPVPLTLQTLAVLLSASALGAWRSITATSAYFGLALAGLPVLAPQTDGTHVVGVDVFSMASLGYVLGFIVASFVVGRMAENGYSSSPRKMAVAMIAGNAAIYTVGMVVLQAITGATLAQTFEWGMFPFIIGDIIKIALAAGILPAAWAAVNKISQR